MESEEFTAKLIHIIVLSTKGGFGSVGHAFSFENICKGRTYGCIRDRYIPFARSTPEILSSWFSLMHVYKLQSPSC